MANFHNFQSLNHYTPRQDFDPGFGVIDNASNELASYWDKTEPQ